MNCPYCGKSDDVTIFCTPTAAKLVAYASLLGLGPLTLLTAGALALTYKATGKLIYKCKNCNKYFIA